MSSLTTLERKIMSDAEDPATKIVTWTPEPQVPQESHEDFLYDLFSVMNRQAQRQHVAQAGSAELVKEANDFALNLRRSCFRGRTKRQGKKAGMERVCRGYGHTVLTVYSR